MSKRIYDIKHHNWIRCNFFEYKSTASLCKEFNTVFFTDISPSHLRSICKSVGFKRNTQHRYTKEQDFWIVQNHEKKSFSNLVQDFNKTFNTNISKGALQQHSLLTLKLRYEDVNRFNNKTPVNYRKCGEERTERGGYTLVKDDKGKWVQKARYVYERKYGPVDKAYQIIYLDGNKGNVEISNLAKVPKQSMLMLNRNNWLGKGEISKTAILYCDLHYATTVNK